MHLLISTPYKLPRPQTDPYTPITDSKNQLQNAYIVNITHIYIVWCTHATLWIPFGKLCLLCPQTDSIEASLTQQRLQPLDLRHTNIFKVNKCHLVGVSYLSQPQNFRNGEYGHHVISITSWVVRQRREPTLWSLNWMNLLIGWRRDLHFTCSWNKHASDQKSKYVCTMFSLVI